MIFKLKFFIIPLLIFLFNADTIFAQDKGIRFLQMEQFNEAKAYYLKQISSMSSVQNYYQLSKLYLQENKTDSAKQYINAGISKFPNDALMQIALVRYFIIQSSPDSVAKAVSKALSISKSKDQQVLIELAQAYFDYSNTNYERAFEYLQLAKEIDKTSASLYQAFGMYYLKQNKNGEAANEFRRINYYHPENPDGYYLYGKVYFKSGNLTESSTALLKAIELDSNYAPAWRDLGDLYANFGYYKEAVTYYSRYNSLINPTLNDHVKLATYLHFNKDFKSSLDEALLAVKIDSKNFVMKRIISYDYYEIKDYKLALSSINQFFESVPSEKIIATDYEYKGKILSKNSQDSLAVLNYQKAILLDSSKTNLYENIGASYEKMKNYELAIENFQKLIAGRTQPFATDYYYLGRNAYFFGGVINDSVQKLKYFLLADTSFAKVIELNQNSSIGYFWRARVNAILDPESELGLAKPYYEKAASIMELNIEKYKKDLIESYQYLGYYYYLNQDNENSKLFWNKILTIDPENETAQKALKGIK